MTRPLFIALLLCCTGCATLPKAEYAWQSVALVDTLQTVTVAQSPDCLYESDRYAARIYGSPHPGAARVIEVNSALAVIHAGVASFLSALGWTRALDLFEDASLLYSGTAVVHNTRMGIGLAAGDICTNRSSSSLP